MPRKHTDLVQTGLRVRESLRRRLEAAAEKNGLPLNREMMNRLERSFDADAARSIEQVAADLSNTWSRIRKTVNA